MLSRRCESERVRSILKCYLQKHLLKNMIEFGVVIFLVHIELALFVLIQYTDPIVPEIGWALGIDLQANQRNN